MADEEYEILPHQLLEDLKYDVEALKKKLTEPDAKANELILEIESLKDTAHELNEVFKTALTELKEDDLGKKISAVVSQNEAIAKGLVAISDRLDSWMRQQGNGGSSPSPRTATTRHTLGAPRMPGPAMTAPPLIENVPFPDTDLPPPPPSIGGKKKLIGNVFK